MFVTTGLRIATVDGDTPLVHLACGDYVATASAGLAPVHWLGHRRVDLTRHPERRAVEPIRIPAGAMDGRVPTSDVLVSPAHGILIGDVLVPARHLVGCRGIAVETGLDVVDYHHVELPFHDVLLANGLPCESWLESGDRAMFSNSGVAALHFHEHGRIRDAGDKAIVAERLTGGPALTAIRQRLSMPSETSAAMGMRYTHP